MLASLIIENLSLSLFLGVTPAERAKKQKVLVTIKIVFAKPPLACVSDQLADTICYDQLVQKIKKFCRNYYVELIEHLGARLFALVKQELPVRAKLYVKIAKPKPLPELNQSVFELEGKVIKVLASPSK